MLTASWSCWWPYCTPRARSRGSEHPQGWAEAEGGCDCTSFQKHPPLWMGNGYRWSCSSPFISPLAGGSHQSSPDWKPSIEKDEGSRGPSCLCPQRPCALSTQQKYRGAEFPSGQVFCLLLLYQYVSLSLCTFDDLTNFPGSWKMSSRRMPHCSASALLPNMNCHCALQRFLMWVIPELGHNP